MHGSGPGFEEQKWMTENVSQILVVDDDYDIAEYLADALRLDDYQVTEAHSGREALDYIQDKPFDLVIMDVMMPELNGFQTCEILKNLPEVQNTPVIFLTGLNDAESKIRGLQAGASDFLSKPTDMIELKLRVRNMLKIGEYSKFLRNYNQILEKEVAEKTEELQRTYKELGIAHQKIKSGYIDTIYRLTLAAEYKDTDTADHLQRISKLSAYFARQLGLSEKEIEIIYFASPMHDIGKIAIPNSILLKPARLTKREFEEMQDHTVIGKKLLAGSESEILQAAETIAATHHEKYDGSGYPNGLTGDQIPLIGRVVMIVDIYDALRSIRPYKSEYPHEKAIDVMLKGDERLNLDNFDPQLRKAFIEINSKIARIYDAGQTKDLTLEAILRNNI